MRYEAFKFNGVPVKNPSTFKIERYNITDLARMANGNMAGDLIAKKRKFFFTYAAISAREMNKILEAIWETPLIFFKLEYMENGLHKEAMVYAGAIPTQLHSAHSTEWVWKEVNFDLIEQ